MVKATTAVSARVDVAWAVTTNFVAVDLDDQLRNSEVSRVLLGVSAIIRGMVCKSGVAALQREKLRPHGELQIALLRAASKESTTHARGEVVTTSGGGSAGCSVRIPLFRSV